VDSRQANITCRARPEQGATRELGKTRGRIVIIVVALVAIGSAVGLTVWLTSAGGSTSALSHTQYAQLYASAVVGKTRESTALADWPKPPYQDFVDGAGHRCFEWFDKPILLYDLCFDKQGVLVTRQTP
jgi:hypothetical protein